MALKPSIPKGTRDFSPKEVAKRNYIQDVLKNAFLLFGFQPIETPSFENSETLMGKYGEEGDRLIFRILDSGDFMSKVTDPSILENSAALAPVISEKALRYDLTVPFARYVVMHRNEIVFPFKRYQMQPVWRADRPQKGRFREFYQCDADVVGSDSLWQEVEFVRLYDMVFSTLGLQGITIKLNHRKILTGIAETIGAKQLLVDFTVALDKLDKIGRDGVEREMMQKGIEADSIAKLAPLFELSGDNRSRLITLRTLLQESEVGLQGVTELETIIERLKDLGGISAEISIEITLARGLNYYTGMILEVAAPKNVIMGSLGGGGRYDDLTGIFGMEGVSGVGISFGLDRIGLVMDELELFPPALERTLDVLCLNFGEAEALASLQLISRLRARHVKADLYPSDAKIQKQFKYANSIGVPFVVMIGEEELAADRFVVKDMVSGVQTTYDLDHFDDFWTRL